MKNFKTEIGIIVEKILDVTTSYYIAKSSRKNSDSINILVYTDSRGYNVTKVWYRHNAITNKYVMKMKRTNSVKLVMAPFSHTSILDFVEFHIDNSELFKTIDTVILHLGIVDFAPRPRSSLEAMKLSKSTKEKKLGFSPRHAAYSIEYEREQLFSYMSLEDLSEVLCRFDFLKNCIWILPNPVISTWRGAYWKDRPKNINQILKYNRVFDEHDVRTVDLSGWTTQEIKTYTTDNVHYSAAGFKAIYFELEKLLRY
jgi:hypothetical protein